MKQLLLMFILGCSVVLFAQPSASFDIKTGSIFGRVLDGELNQPLPYVNVIIKDVSEKIITGGITDDEGKFNIKDIPEGKVNVEIAYIGFKTINKSITIGKGNYKINLGDISLSEDSENLDEVVVVAETSTIQQKVDRKVITIGKDLAASGTAINLMSNLPSVNVDQQTGSISLRGNQNVQVMVDGKLTNVSPEQLLRQLPSSSIKQIELITNPSAKYNPDGLSGIINIVLHKNVNIGFNGNVTFGLAYQELPKFNSSIDMNYRNGKLNFFGNYGNNINRNINYGNVNRINDSSQQLFNTLSRGESHLAKFGLDFYLNEKNTISVFTNQNTFNGDNTNTTKILYPDASRNEFQDGFNDNENHSQQYNFNYKLDFAKEGRNIELEVDHNTFEGDSFTDNDFTVQQDFIEINNIERDRTTINIDYTNPLSETSKLEFGLQARLFENNIDYFSDARLRDEFTSLPFPADINFDYTRNIYSSYATFSKSFEKWSFQLGVRAETVNVDSESFQTNLDTNETSFIPFENDYTELYPSAFLTYNSSEKNSYQLSYSRRIDRPGVGQVNPLPEWNTPLISSFGNQELLPQFTNSIELNYTRKLGKGSITGGVFYRVIQDEINRAVFIDRADLNRIILTFDNFDTTNAYGVEISTNYRPTKWWSLNGSFDLFAQTQSSFTEVLTEDIDIATTDDIITKDVKVDNVVYNFRVFNNFKVNKALTFSLFAMYRGANKNIQFDVESMALVNLGMRYNFLQDDRATFSLNFNDIFSTMYFGFDGDSPFPQDGRFNWESRTIFGGLSYRFGGGKYRAKSRKRRDNDEKSSSGGFM